MFPNQPTTIRGGLIASSLGSGELARQEARDAHVRQQERAAALQDGAVCMRVCAQALQNSTRGAQLIGDQLGVRESATLSERLCKQLC